MILKRHLVWLAILLSQLLLLFSARAYTPKDANTLFSAYNSAFYMQKGTNGYIKDTQTGGEAYFWGQANMIECYIDAWEWNSNTVARGMITNLLNGFMSYNGVDWTYNDYNDDIMWAVMAFARGGVATGNTNYCAIAKANFDACYARAWSTNLGGGLYWRNSDRQSKNACVNGPGAIAAYLLYQVYGDTNYLNKATNIYAWERSVLFNSGNGQIYDNIGTNSVLSTWASSYNQGTFIGAANFLAQTNDAKLAAQYTMLFMSGGGILPEYGIAGNNSGFNAIFYRWFVRFMKNRNLQGTYEPWLQTNAVAAWNIRRTADNLSWCQWYHPTPAGTNFYSWDCISSFEILQAADPTQGAAAQSIPANPAGYYPLDATSGTVAVDANGSSNNGVVNNATWNSSGGRFSGCLVFNGVNSSVQITNPVCNDFSIAFWVKTSQATGSGQWYNGVGLVDADAPLSNDDFGTGLVGGKFAFGVGNPDTTIVSTSTINNGVWHHCVATRQQVTGVISVYVDGALQATGTANRNTLDATARILFGAHASGGGYFNGSLDDVRIFSRTLSSGEVAALYSNSIALPPGAPTNLVATAGNAAIQLSWAEAPLATSYNVKRSLVVGGPYATITNVSTTTFIDATSTNSHTYYYVVSPVNAAGEGANSAEVSASPLALAAWFKADALTGLSSGAGVSLWPDASGNGYNAFQATAGNQPTYVTGAINGLPVVRFNAANSSYLWFYRPVQDDFTIICVFKSASGIGTGTDFWSGAGLVNGEQSGSVNDFGISLNANGQVLAGTGNPDKTAASGTGYANNVPHVVTFKRTRSNGFDSLYVDGVQQTGQIGGTQSLTAPNFLVLGGQGVLNNFLTGDIAEVQIYNSALTDVDRFGQEKALKCKYGLTGGAVPSAPAGVNPVAGNRQIALNWTMIAGAASYSVWRSTNGGASYSVIATGLTGSSYVDTNAANGQTNYYKVTGADACGAGNYSTAANVLLPLPPLGMTAGAGALVLNWPGWANDWKLYAATNLTPPLAWTLVTNAVSTNNSQFNVSLPMDANAKFFRLTSP
ncbi:MAG: glycoside hydrolase family 76 protein [Verrucomicrobiae bacterium]|nr:glycoside hydrolase family 76 protein [Verrucomicrobiae bacterium]